ncbi:MAG: hypothetical protein ACXVA6_21745 [Isosphaeraceae bacterium]
MKQGTVMARGFSEELKLLLLIVILATVDLPAYGQAGGPTNNADLVIRHAHVITLDAGSHIVQAVAIRGDRIEAVGTDDEIQPLVGPGTKIIDAGGKSLLPGLYDSHVHPLGAAHSEADHPIPVFESLADVMNYISRSRSAHLPRRPACRHPRNLDHGCWPDRLP